MRCFFTTTSNIRKIKVQTQKKREGFNLTHRVFYNHLHNAHSLTHVAAGASSSSDAAAAAAASAGAGAAAWRDMAQCQQP